MPEPYQFVIIGSGAACTAAIKHLSTIKTGKPFSVIVIEKGEKLGSGFPYSEKVVLREQHIVNTVASRLDIGTTNISGDSDFITWVRSLNRAEREEYGLKTAIAQKTTFFSPRYAVGKYLEDRFKKYVTDARKNKIKVEPLSGVEATNIETNPEGEAVITLSNGRKISSKNVMLATGHWLTSRFNNKGYFPNPWPASELLEKVPAKNVAIIGSNLGAIDTALTLSSKFGKFLRRPSGKLEFIKNPDAEHFFMTMYSNSGKLPEVTGYISPDKFSYKYVTTENLEKLHRENDEFLSLDGFFRLFKQEVIAQAPVIRKFIPDVDTLNLEDFFLRIEELFASKPQIDKLRDDIERAHKSLNTHTPIALQHVIFKSYAIFSEITQFFSAEDLIRYKRILPTLHKIVVPFPIQNAEKMMALLEEGCLKTVGLGADGVEKLSPGRDGLDIIRPDDEMIFHRFHHDIVIDALGQSGNIAKDPSALYQSLLKNGLIRPVFVKFADQSMAAKLYTSHKELDIADVMLDTAHKKLVSLEDKHIAKSQSKELKYKAVRKELFKDFPRGSIKEVGGIYYYKAPGILVDMSKFKVISPDSNTPLPNIYTVGPNTSGQAAILQDLGTIVGCAEIIVNEVKNNLGLCPNVSRLHRSQQSGSESIAASQSGGNILNYLRSLAAKKYAKEYPHNQTTQDEKTKELGPKLTTILPIGARRKIC